MLIINLFFAGFSSMTVTSRIGFAMARDGALPCSKFWYRINQRTKTPDRIIFLVFLTDVLFCLLPLISEYAFSAITSITTIGYQISYAVPIVLRLTVSRNTFQKSSFHLGPFSEVIGWVSVVWLVITSIFFLLPNQFDDNMRETPTNFNYTPVVLVGFFIIAMVYWFLPAPYGARHFFVGPKRDSVIEILEKEKRERKKLLEEEEVEKDSN